MTARAIIEDKSARLSDDFARDFISRRFGQVVADALYEALPRFTRGKRKGLPKGALEWMKCTRGGWARRPGDAGRVYRPGSYGLCVVVNGRCVLDEFANATDDMRIDYLRRVLGFKAVAA